MPITVSGVRLTSISADNNEDQSKPLKLTGSYHLMASNGKILAKQTFNNYNDVVVDFSRETKELYQKLLVSLTSDLNATLGVAESQ